MEKQKGQYLGTEVSGKWWKRYRERNYFSRGNGEWWYNEQGFYFLRYFAKEPIFIPLNSIIGFKIGKWHSGRWALGNNIFKIIWKKDNLELSSGFIVSNGREEAVKLKEILAGRIK